MCPKITDFLKRNTKNIMFISVPCGSNWKANYHFALIVFIDHAVNCCNAVKQMFSDFYSCCVKSISLNINIVKLTCSIIRQDF